MQTIHFEIEQSTTFSKQFVARTGRSNTSPVIDLTGYTVKSECKRSYTSYAAFAFTVEITDAQNGVFTLSMTDTQTRDLPVARMIYDVKIVDPQGVASRIVEGIIHIKPSITDSNPYTPLQGVKIMDPEVVHKHTNKDVLDTITSVSQTGLQWRLFASGSPEQIEHVSQNGDRIFVDTSVHAIDVVVPAVPTEQYSIEIHDSAGTFDTNNVRIITDESPATILYTQTRANSTFKAVYSDETGWKILNTQYTDAETLDGFDSSELVQIANTQTVTGQKRFSDVLVLAKGSDKGIMVDVAAPTYPWHDLTGAITREEGGANAPVIAVYKGGIKGLRFGVNDEAFVEYHLPHDYVKGTDIYIHAHWSHNSAAAPTGTVTWGFEATYSKGHQQAAFGNNVTVTIEDAATSTQYFHRIAEVQLSAAGGAGGRLDTSLLEPDGIILVRVYLSANALTGGVEPFCHFADIHYQSNGKGTKQKSPDFYV